MPEEIFLTSFRGGQSHATVQPKRLHATVKLMNKVWKEFQQTHPQFQREETPEQSEQGLLLELSAYLIKSPYLTDQTSLESHIDGIEQLMNMPPEEFIREVARRLGVEEIHNVSIQRVFFEWLELYTCVIKKVAKRVGRTLPLKRWKETHPESSSEILSNIIEDKEFRLKSNRPEYQKPIDEFYRVNANFEYKGFCRRVPHDRLKMLLQFDIRPLFKIIKKEHKIPADLKLDLHVNQYTFVMPRLHATGSKTQQLMKALETFMLALNTALPELLKFEADQISRAKRIDDFAEAIRDFCKSI